MTNSHDADNLPGPVARVSEEWRPDYDPHAWVDENQPPPTETPPPVSAADLVAELVGDPDDTPSADEPTDHMTAIFGSPDEPTHDTPRPSYVDSLTADELAELEADLNTPWDDPEAEAKYNAWMAQLTAEGAPVELAADERTPEPPQVTDAPTLPGGPLRERLIRGKAILEIPQPKWLVQGLVQESDVTNLVGPAGCGKTFLALDMALSVLTGQPWQGHTTNADPIRPVLWLAGEGLPELGKRIKAWCTHYGVDVDSIIDRFDVLPGGGNLSDPDMAMYLQQLTGALDMQPQLVVIDTLARHTLGTNEQDNTAMGLVFDVLQKVANLDAAVLTVHHTGKDTSKGGRGASSVDGHVRSIMTMTPATENKNVATVRHVKANNAGLAPDWTTERVPAGLDPATGQHLSMVSVVGEAKLLGAADRIVAILLREDQGEGVRHKDIKNEAMKGMSHSTFSERLNDLVASGRVAKYVNNGRYYVPDNQQPQMI